LPDVFIQDLDLKESKIWRKD